MTTTENKPVTTQHNVVLTITHKSGGFPSAMFLQRWLESCLNCNANHAEVDVVLQKPEDAIRANVTAQVLTGVASMGDVFTDAPEAAHQVARARNLMTLAAVLSSASTLLATGTLLADNAPAGTAQVFIDGSLVADIAEGVDTSGRKWTLVLPNGKHHPVNFFAGEFGDDEAWVLADAQAFYQDLLTP